MNETEINRRLNRPSGDDEEHVEIETEGPDGLGAARGAAVLLSATVVMFALIALTVWVLTTVVF